jgi:uncharacterized protein YndB with AHSA1/START domain
MDAATVNEPWKNSTTVERRSDRELVLTRTFNGPARVVFDAWTKPELLKRWWAPKSFGVSLFECEIDLREGGRYRYVFGRDPHRPMVFSGKFTEVAPPSRLVCTQLFEPERSAGEAVVTATFEEQAGKTRLVLHQLFPSKEALDGAVASGMEDGMRVTMDQLDELVLTLREPTPIKNRTTVERKSDREVVVTRTINGPARIIFDAFTKPELLKRWWTPKSFGVFFLSCEADVRVGGRYRFVFGLEGSPPMAFTGKYVEVTPPTRLVWTSDESEAGESVTTVTFEETAGKTLVVIREIHPSKEALDAHLASGWDQGMRETLDQLDELAVALRSDVARA